MARRAWRARGSSDSRDGRSDRATGPRRRSAAAPAAPRAPAGIAWAPPAAMAMRADPTPDPSIRDSRRFRSARSNGQATSHASRWPEPLPRRRADPAQAMGRAERVARLRTEIPTAKGAQRSRLAIRAVSDEYCESRLPPTGATSACVRGAGLAVFHLGISSADLICVPTPQDSRSDVAHELPDPLS